MTRYLVLRSDATTVCGVEAFTRNLAARLSSRAVSDVLDGNFRRLSERLADADAIVLNFPIVAWKKRLVEPFAAAALAKLKRKRVVVVLHEWASLDWKRRLTLWPVILLADTILFSAPEVRQEWLESRYPVGRKTTGIIPIPPNLLPSGKEDAGPAALAIRALRAGRRTIIGQFGSIYPKKNCAELLGIARALLDEGQEVAIAFVGSFIKGMDNVEEDFRNRVEALGLGDRVMVTGYLATDEEVFAACREVDIFCYRFSEGLTARRGSVLAAALGGRIVVTNAPADPAGLGHHGLFQVLIRNGNIVICPHDADVEAMAKAVRGVIGRAPPSLDIDVEIASLWKAIIGELDGVQSAVRTETRSIETSN
ncbi:glycosyltransferase [Aliirhizobium smilacinae]|uniref:Glycosyltransferase family 4 protein n=1 Tax=Aliirhizobium smilacinae TaxID=1395944 RepID=A0A5C4XFL6_9HYPH|nr:glycosyltransferase [Rhizobium smilacinae]TNM61264.1 glycosyltransferase family 4 protein [Rhizobium smilacinae]